MQKTMTKTRWIRYEDVPECVVIAAETLEDLWTPALMKKQLKRRRCFAKVAADDTGIVGFIICEATIDDISIIAIAIRPDRWREGIGAELLKSVMSGHHAKTREEIYCAVREYNTRAHLFFKEMGFLCLLIAEDDDHSFYVFERKLPE